MAILWQVMATVALLRLVPAATAFNPLQGTSDRILHPEDPFFGNFGSFDDDDDEDGSNKLQPPPLPASVYENVFSREADFSVNVPPTTPRATQTLLASPSKFDINTFTFNEGNVRKADDIFTILADVEDTGHAESDRYNSQTKQQMVVTPSKMKPASSSTGIPGVGVANGLSKKILLATKKVEDLLSVAQQMKKKVDAKMQPNSPSFQATSSSNDSSHLADLLLDASELEKMQKTVLTSNTKEEFLDRLTSMLLGAETRQGSALTLDPVTIIALLTLAAYLIRAVYQILTVTGRSLEMEDILLPLQLSDLPDAMVNVHNWISSSDVALAREERAVYDVGSILDIPGNLAAIIKLQREGHRPCVRQFLCEQLQRRTLPEVTLTDIFVAALGFYFGETDLATYIDSTLSSRSSCDILPDGCSPFTLRDAHYLESLYTRASYKFFHLLVTINNFL